MLRCAALAAVLSACPPPKPTSDPALDARIAELAESREPPGDPTELTSAIALAHTDASLPAARDYLVAWAGAHGGLVTSYDPDWTVNSGSAVLRILGRFSDDATLGAAVYFATRLRREGHGLIAMMFAASIETKLVALRPVADPAWRTSRVRDDELDRLVVSEVAWEYADAGANSRDDEVPAIDAFAHGVLAARDLSRASRQSAAPLYPIEVIVHMVGRGFEPHALAPYIAKWTTAQRAYNAWLDR